ncbi:MAG: copper resistance protein NlpE [Acidobacteriota bacterium]|jgi:uncharacterized lipoprotein NlpE involved in copper resistance|nr:copper resistance protein NlpE [Acidobacteriota bacterium]
MNMKKIFYTLAVAAFTLVFCACASSQPAGTEQSSKQIQDWAGVYAGVIPAASGPGINVTITLKDDFTYEVRYRYIDRGNDEFTVAGTFEWNMAGGVIKLDAADLPPYYQVGEGRLIQLDMEGKLITGILADDYILKKQ